MRRLIFVFMVLSISLMGQSPYYRLAYGDLFPVTDPLGSSLGSGVVALQDSARISIHNPAALNSLKQVYFGGILGSEFRSTAETMTNNTRLEQINIAFPAGKKLGMSFGIRAVSDFESNYEIPISDGMLIEKSGGGIWDYQFGLGYAPIPSLSLGLKLHTLHGYFRRQSNIQSADINELYVLKGSIDGKSLELGMIAQLGDKVSLGFTADVPYEKPSLDGTDSLAGTDEYTEIMEELSAWPTTINLGVVYHHSQYTKFIVGLKQQIFSDSGFENARIFALPPGWKTVPVASLQLAMQRLALDRTSRNIIRRMGWQAGVSVKNYYLVSSDENNIYEYALMSGINLSLRNGKSIFDISGEFGTRGGDESLPDEMFARVKFGIQVNDMWFRKAKRR